MTREKLLLIGNGMAGVRTIEEILDRDAERYDITIIGEENYTNYNRIMLSNVLQNKNTIEEIITNPASWYAEQKIELVHHDPAVSLNTGARKVRTQSGKEIGFDKCILATGSRSFILPVEGSSLEGVLGFRTIDDTLSMLETAKSYRKAAVIGGGLLGLEAAKGLVDQGMDVTVVHLEKWLMETQLNEMAGKLLKADLEQQGLKFLMEKKTSRILGDTRVTGLEFSDGSILEADMVIMTVGIRPETALARQAGLAVNRGIVVNDWMETSAQGIYAVGECAEHQGKVYGLVAPLFEQGKVLADVLTGRETAPYGGSTTYTSLKVSGCDLFSAGEIKEVGGVKSIEAYDGLTNSYKKLFIKDNQVVGIVLYGDTSEENRYFKLLKQKQDISALTSVSLLPAGGGCCGGSAADDVTQWADDETICGCNGVTKGTILQAIRGKDLKSVAEVTKATKAGGSCGKCKGMIGDLLTYVLGDRVATAPTGICGCTDLSRDEIVLQIHEKGLTTTDEVYEQLGFRNREGCPKCRPAINFYLNVAFPKEHGDEPASRFVNERLHANIQNNGTFSVIPRMRGGQTTPQQLMQIARVAEKYEVPLVKVTGSQRIGLYGVKKEDLPNMWEELDMTSASAYAKAVRSVKTCVGAAFCRFGTQDSMGLGIKLEERYEFIDTPHKFKMGVSACPRSCAETGVKDFGVIGVENGFQIYIGGNGGTEVQEGQLLTTVETEQEVIDICGAFLQYYRETGIYAERTAPWLKRMGFDHVKKILLSAEQRAELLKRLDEAVEGKRRNPWQQVVEDPKLQKDLYAVVRG
ncbi:nitrite reductase large subunit NirB [Paenibacillus physcomitrellae]|uniref:Nitrite reductase large subunit n=1 Tax=Paenibacillus physcomitrellae TaxID=1619311 RepID=A0ABQ1FPW9_9BACL|nr:nitrite reductase large subunit NirB [Paenibacillus physcomitrellae]GGA24547.1 nitrite reductase large subunit [Paenibacillus physcomitrellae]